MKKLYLVKAGTSIILSNDDGKKWTITKATANMYFEIEDLIVNYEKPANKYEFKISKEYAEGYTKMYVEIEDVKIYLVTEE